MKKKLLYFLALLFSIFALAGCSVGSKPSQVYSDFYVPDVIDMGNAHYYYTIDKRTGVVYLSYSEYNHHGITVMLNADGTPVTADQLGIEFDSTIKGIKK